MKETLEPSTLSRQEWDSLLHRSALGYSSRPLEEVNQVGRIRALRSGAACLDDLQNCLEANIRHGLGPIMITGCLWMGVTSFKSIFGNDEILEKQLFAAMKDGLVGDLLAGELVGSDWNLKGASLNEFLSLLKGLGIGLSANQESAEEASFIKCLCSDLESMNEGVKRLESVFSEIDSMVLNLALSEHADGSLIIDKGLRNQLKSTAEEIELLQDIIEKLVRD